jgi:Secretion system C-terminal sorting domain
LFVETALPIAYWYDSNTGQSLWRDLNNNGTIDLNETRKVTESGKLFDGGWFIEPDKNGNLWNALDHLGTRKIKFKGEDANGIPDWDIENCEYIACTQEFSQVRRIQYNPTTDVMVIGGGKGTDNKQHWKATGPVLACYDNWSKPNRALRWAKILPIEIGTSGHFSCEPIGFSIAGDYIFTSYTASGTTLGFSYGHVEVNKISDGSRVGFMEPSNAIGIVGIIDVVNPISAHKLKNGEYIVLLEDDAFAKNVLYRWCPSGNCLQITTDLNESVVSETNQNLLYPNPSQDFITIDANKFRSIHIYDARGNKVMNQVISEAKVNISQLADGFYVAEMVDVNGVAVRNTFVVSK